METSLFATLHPTLTDLLPKICNATIGLYLELVSGEIQNNSTHCLITQAS